MVFTIATTKSFTYRFSLLPPKIHFKSLHTITVTAMTTSSSSSRQPRTSNGGGGEGLITSQEWQRWGPISQVPSIVNDVIQDLKMLEKNIDAHMVFGGIGGKLKGDFRVQEDKKHRATYEALGDSEKKFQFFSARQIACRLLGSRDYLCQKCWLPQEDCMCSKVKPSTLKHNLRFWVYMHPKDFLRQNNTGKLLWQVFGVEAATLCIFGIPEDEELMWNAFKLAGKNRVWCLYPNQNTLQESLLIFNDESPTELDGTELKIKSDETLNFILLDGTWSNSAAMLKRLKDQAKLVWGDEDLPCITLSTGASAMHKLRPQPSWDRTCTAAAAIGLLSELQGLPKFSSCGLDEQAEAVEDAVVVLLEALTARRVRMGRSITRKQRHNNDIC
ncbi:hypothetical protein ACFE04_029904 [Oxalis oulophora]